MISMEESEEDKRFRAKLRRGVDEMRLSVRSANGLKNGDINYIGDLVQKTKYELLRLPNFGRRSLAEIEEVLAQMDLRLNMDVPEAPYRLARILAKDMIALLGRRTRSPFVMMAALQIAHLSMQAAMETKSVNEDGAAIVGRVLEDIQHEEI